MSYYAAGGYYSAGGFSFRKLIRAATKATSFVASNPILSSVVGMVPGASSALGAFAMAGQAFGSSAHAAIAQSTAGTPGHNAYMPRTRQRRMRRLRRSR